MLKILSAKTVAKLEMEAEEYDIKELGSLTISNGHYFLSFMGVPKVKPEVTKEPPSKPEVTPEKPKPKTRRKKPNTKL